jgi:membrane-associated protease RseP (regulator of RpoE activity)
VNIKELIEIANAVIHKRLKLDWASRLYKAPVYKISKRKIDLFDLEEIQEELLAKGIFSELSESPRQYYLRVLKYENEKAKPRYFLSLLLFILTVFTTSIVGANFQGKDPFTSFTELSSGFSYAFALLFILLAHEMGHFIYAKIYKIDVSLPFFIPLFLPVFHPGTMGAFIRMRSPIPNKKALFDVGVAGPIAGFMASLIILTIGFYFLPDEEGVWRHVASVHPIGDGSGIQLIVGGNILFELLKYIFNAAWIPMGELYHFPLIFAGWFGLLLTALNLMPIGQLDGGHLSYAFFGRKASYVAVITFLLMVSLSLYLIFWHDIYSWILWPLLILFFIRFKHPPTLNDSLPIDPTRKWIGWLAYLIFLICFTPMPLYIG